MKMEMIVFAILASLLLIAGCGSMPAEEPEQTEDIKEEILSEVMSEPADAEETSQPQVEVTEETSPEPEITETEEPEKKEIPVVELSPELKELVTKAKDKVKSYKYLYAAASDEVFKNTYFIKGNKIKIKLSDEGIYAPGKYFDTIYLDTSTKYATARCEDRVKCISDKVDYTKKATQSDFSDYIVKTPFEWVDEIISGEIIGPEVINGRTTKKIKFEKDGKETIIWVGETYGMPLQITMEDPETGIIEKWQFSDYEFNTLRDSDVIPAFETDQF